jgi:hypothetical protein
MTFEELKDIYSKYFTLGYVNASNNRSNIENRFVLISLIDYVYSKNKPKNPDMTYYSLIYKLAQGLGLEDSIIKGLAIVCEDFAYGSEEFPTFGLKGQDIIKEIRAILKELMPF